MFNQNFIGVVCQHVLKSIIEQRYCERIGTRNVILTIHPAKAPGTCGYNKDISVSRPTRLLEGIPLVSDSGGNVFVSISSFRDKFYSSFLNVLLL